MTFRIALFSAASVAVAFMLSFFGFLPVGAQSTGFAITSGPSVASQEITATAATVRWTTSTVGIGRVYYGETSALGSSWSKLEGIGPEETEVSEAAHALRLEELKPATTYFYKVWSRDASGTAIESGQSTFTTSAATVATLDSIILSSPATGAKLKSPVTFRVRVVGTASSVTFTYASSGSAASALQCVGKKDNDSGTEQNWSCGPVTIAAGDYSVSATALGVDASGAAAARTSVSLNFTVEAACTEDLWECAEWGACTSSTAGYVQNRTCTLKTDCPNVTTPAKPATTQACTPPCTKDEWSCAAWGTCAKDASGTLVQSRSCTLKTDCPAVTTPKPETSQACLPSPGCTKDTWSCGEWSSCAEPGTKTKKRACELLEDCPNATTPKPEEVADCPPSCTEDVWNCTEWGKCDKTGSERRICAKDFDCPGVDTPKPPEARACMLPTELEDVNAPMINDCERDLWRCSDWGECVNGARARKCALDYDCPNVNDPSPGETEKCEPPTGQAPPPQELRDAAVEAVMDRMSGAMRTSVQDFEKNTENVSGGFGLAKPTGEDVNAPSPAERSVDLTGLYIPADDGELARSLAGECAEAGINGDRCAEWLKARHATGECTAAGAFSKESCERHLIDANDGTFPGCAGLTPDACEKVAALALLGRPSSDVKQKADDILRQAVDENVAPPLRGLLATDDALLDKLAIVPAANTEGQESSPALVVLDADGDGLSDDLENRIGTNPTWPDVEGGGMPNGRPLPRNVLKSFFEANGKPVQFAFIDTDGDGAIDLIEDRNLLGLKTYDPTKVYLIGDTSVAAREILKKFFENGDVPTAAQKGDKPTSSQFGNVIDSMISIDTDGDGVPNGKVSRAVLKGFFEKGDTPTQARPIGDEPTDQPFGDVIDSSLFSPVDRALVLGTPLPQPLGAGEVDESFTLQLGASERPGDGGEAAGTSKVESFTIKQKSATDGNAPAAPGGIVFNGKAEPNSVVLLYFYSYVPMVMTAQTDENGNFTVEVESDVLAEGEHEMYVAITDDTGKIAKKSNPLAFFVKEAQAVSEEEYLQADFVPTAEPIQQWQRAYLMGTALAIVLALGFAWFFLGRRLGETPPAPPQQQQ